MRFGAKINAEPMIYTYVLSAKYKCKDGQVNEISYFGFWWQFLKRILSLSQFKKKQFGPNVKQQFLCSLGLPGRNKAVTEWKKETW